MRFQIVAGIVAAALVILYIAPVVVKLKDVALTAVASIGIVLMLIDLWQSLKAKDNG